MCVIGHKFLEKAIRSWVLLFVSKNEMIFLVNNLKYIIIFF